MSEPRIWAVLPAAGVGRRMGGPLPKQYLPLAGRPVIARTLDRLLALPAVHGAVVALSPEDNHWDALGYRHRKPVHRVPGGAERSDSVQSVLHWLAEQGGTRDYALVHDAVRPCVGMAELERLIDRARDERGGLLAFPVRDTLKRDDGDGHVARTVDREGLWHALTPQLFPVMALREALAKAGEAGLTITDDASAMEAVGGRPRLIPGEATNIKITRPADLALAEAILVAQGGTGA
ncbi:2-C-methyl-D-erythritol 4-phosphate cytidylyltransferase [Alkalilimnicola ehrlichii MLHE-1]|uniref:2-C-methyl-D-erythritol 4-phosphate cytidylyltransferase n=1 Tax=Alkalilimnicola ehrlichii (strain ATCC BAA-1101 / DSM 17681 / MLHE-1) TaxID=187272 RepID=Q0A7K6_ALKEH|nr:2-C-methyl-D-erythritol 4-phosphate cytidylyltransferase [Alkalilimnicola ehrlichii]ABI57181.1 2-C-methyl-D-erythritol 4-phosphate cytidylyltransferase [Alkalilimnicola ehrlichii MLHE-1]